MRDLDFKADFPVRAWIVVFVVAISLLFAGVAFADENVTQYNEQYNEGGNAEVEITNRNRNTNRNLNENWNENSNRNNNFNANYQEQGQEQEQGQSQSQVGINEQGQSQSARISIRDKNKQTVVVEGDTYKPLRQSPPAFAPGLSTSNGTCMGSSSLGLSGPFGGLSIGTSWKDEDCNLRFFATMAARLGLDHVALTILSNNTVFADALRLNGVPFVAATVATVVDDPLLSHGIEFGDTSD